MPFAVKSYDVGSYSKYRSDFTQPGFEYHGYTVPGTLTSVPKWRVFRVTLNADGTAAAIDFMNGSNDMDQVWDNRLSLNGINTSYS